MTVGFLKWVEVSKPNDGSDKGSKTESCIDTE